MRFAKTIKRGRSFDVIGFGTNAVDHLITVPEYPLFNSKIKLSQRFQAAGGEIASTLVGLSRLGWKCRYIGRFGDDREGHFGIESLRNEGVDVEASEIIPGAETQVAYILIDERSGERTVIWDRDEKLAYRAEEVVVDLVSDCSLFHCTPHDAAAAMKLAQMARQSGVIVSIDIDNIFHGIDELLPMVDILITSAEFPTQLLGMSDREMAIKEMQARFGCSLTGVTLGEEGGLFYSEGSFIRCNAFPVPGGCKDTTGAGDAFRAGLIHGLLEGCNLEAIGTFANAVAALKCRSVGARTSLPNRCELNELVGTRA